MPGVPVSGESAMRVFEGDRQGIATLRDRDHMNVVRHKAVSEDGNLMKGSVIPQQVEVHGAVGIAIQDEAARVAALRDVMRNVDGNDPGESTHTRNITETLATGSDFECRAQTEHSQFGRTLEDRFAAAKPAKMGNVPSVPDKIRSLLWP